MNPQLFSYINGSRQRGDSDETIRSTLINHGWRPVIVDQAFTALTPEEPVESHHSHRGLALKAALALSLLIVPYLSVNFVTAMQNNSQVSERNDDTDTLQILLEDYQNRTGAYPTLTEANDPAFRVEQLRAYDQNRFTTPGGTDTALGPNGYGYQAYAADKSPCDNITKTCVAYELNPGDGAAVKNNL